MAKYNRKCLCCGKEYYFCPTCGKNRNELWRNNYDSENCRKVFMIATDFLAGVMNKDIAIAKLSECDLSGKDNFVDTIKDVVNTLTVKKVENKQEDSVKPVNTVAQKPVQNDVKPNVFNVNKINVDNKQNGNANNSVKKF